MTHEPGERRTSSGARLTIDRLKLMGFSSETVIRIDLDATAGKAVLAALTNNGASASLESPLGALVAYVHGCASVTEEVARCRALLQSARGDR